MSYFAFLVFGISAASVAAICISGPLSGLAVIGFWAAQAFFIIWQNENANLSNLNETDFNRVLCDWIGRSFERDKSEIYRLREKGSLYEFKSGLKRAIDILDEDIRRRQKHSIDTSESEARRLKYIDELAALDLP